MSLTTRCTTPPHRLVFLLLLLLAAATGLRAQLANPHWNITLSDYGYSDFLLDNTPGFEGREYLSGEWGAAVGYHVGATTVTPRWLEPLFQFPNWDTNSDFFVVSPLTPVGVNADDLPIAETTIANDHLRIVLRYEMLDTRTGIPMGLTPASSPAPGQSLLSNRYVLKQTATITNLFAGPISGLQFFQLLHGLNSDRGVYDDRLYPGPLSQFRHDVTLSGVDAGAVGPGSSTAGLEDFIAFHATQAPSGFELGYYGIEGNGSDDHAMGKPSDGVHRSIEDNWTTAPYAGRLDRDAFAPAQRWIAGGARWDLGTLAPNQSVTLDLLLTIVTGTRVPAGNHSSGSCNGGSQISGGVDYDFDSVDSDGSCFAHYSHADTPEIEQRIAQGEFDAISFSSPTSAVQLWDVEFSGAFSGGVKLTFGYDASTLPAGFDAGTLTIYHFQGGAWVELPEVTVDPVAHTIALTATTMGTFALGVSGGTPHYNVAATVAPAGAGTVTGTGSFAAGAVAQLVAEPMPGYAFVRWTQDGVVVGAASALSVNVTGHRALVAEFVAVGAGQVVATSSLPAAGGTTTGGGAYAIGSLATVHATPAPGYKFSKWLENGVTVHPTADYTFTVTGQHTLVAKFKPVFVVSVTVEPADGGEVEVDAKYEMGELAKLRARPSDGYSFVNFTQNGLVVSDDWDFQFTVTGHRDLVAHFALGHRIDVIPEPLNGGSVTGSSVYPDGESIVVTAEPKPGYVFSHWLEGGSVVGTERTLTFSSTVSRVLEAHFVVLPTLLPSMSTSATGLTLSWPVTADAAGWVLEESTDLVNWAPSVRPITQVGEQSQVTIPATERRRFFRLALP